MSSRIRSLLAAASLALVSAACSATPTYVAAPSEAAGTAPTTVTCAGGVVRTLEQAEAFHGCEIIEGDLRIEGSGLTELGTFSMLTEVTGALLVVGNPKLISLAGLANLKRAHSVSISENPRLCAKLGLLPRLAKVEGELSLSRNFGLSAADLDALRVRVQSGVATEVALLP